jgi:hypothetical protein
MDELELQTREALDGQPITQNIFPFQVPLHSLCWMHAMFTLSCGREQASVDVLGTLMPCTHADGERH